MARLRPFGNNIEGTINIPYLVGYLESLIQAEEERGDISASDRTPRGRRLDKAYDALALLTEVCDFAGES